MVDRIDALLRDGNRDGIVTTMMVELIGMSSKDVESLRHSPAWANRLAVAHTLPRELRAVDDYRFDSSRFRNLNIPTLLMLGEKSPPVFKTALEMLASALPHSRTSVLAGQRHIAIDTAPALFAHEILNFLKES
jgi:pimeloyl-ACP methyl ester carboxylesterase